MPTRLGPFIARTRTAYFTMELAIRPEIHTYSGGLGILAGDTARSCVDLELPLVFVTLISRAGYFRQRLDPKGVQTEAPDWWRPAEWCEPLDAMVALEIEGRPVWIRPWLYTFNGPHETQVPVLLLDTDLEQNHADDRTITHHLYGDGADYRLKQEIVLGIGGVRLLRALGFDIDLYHLNEGHAALLTLDLLKRYGNPANSHPANHDGSDGEEVRERCVFTTHTPVDAGHDKFSYALFERMLPGFIDRVILQRFAGTDRLNMTRLALNLSGFVNGVARRHAETTERMFPGYRVHAVTNGVHLGTWVHDAFARHFDREMPRWRHEPEVLVRALEFSDDTIWACHMEAKTEILDHIQAETGRTLNPDVMTIGYARRMTGYKRPLLLFQDLTRLRRIAKTHPFQIIVAGKAHPKDAEGKAAIREIHAIAKRLDGEIDIIFLPNYEMSLAKILVSGTDLWLNTPLPPLEASGTSGMKAALNGVLNLSVLDGWWIEACLDGVTGWAIGNDHDPEGSHGPALYEKLETEVLPLFYEDPARWRWMMKRTIGCLGPCFNSQRMMRRYASEAYFR